MKTDVILLMFFVPVITLFLGYKRTRSKFTLYNNSVVRGWSKKKTSSKWFYMAVTIWFLVMIQVWELSAHYTESLSSAAYLTVPISILVAIIQYGCFSFGSLVAEYEIERQKDLLQKNSP